MMRLVKLVVPELPVHAVSLEQLGVRAAFDGLAVADDDDLSELLDSCFSG